MRIVAGVAAGVDTVATLGGKVCLSLRMVGMSVTVERKVVHRRHTRHIRVHPRRRLLRVASVRV